MVALACGLTAALATVLIHLIAVRLARRPVGEIYFLALALAIAGLSGLAAGGVSAALYAAVLAGSGIVAFLLLFIGVEHDSPTLALIGYVARHGADGMPEDGIDGFIETHPFTRARIDRLIQQGVMSERQGRYVASGAVGPMIRIAAAYRRIARMQTSAG